MTLEGQPILELLDTWSLGKNRMSSWHYRKMSKTHHDIRRTIEDPQKEMVELEAETVTFHTIHTHTNFQISWLSPHFTIQSKKNKRLWSWRQRQEHLTTPTHKLSDLLILTPYLHKPIQNQEMVELEAETGTFHTHTHTQTSILKDCNHIPKES